MGCERVWGSEAKFLFLCHTHTTAVAGNEEEDPLPNKHTPVGLVHTGPVGRTDSRHHRDVVRGLELRAWGEWGGWVSAQLTSSHTFTRRVRFRKMGVNTALPLHAVEPHTHTTHVIVHLHETGQVQEDGGPSALPLHAVNRTPIHNSRHRTPSRSPPTRKSCTRVIRHQRNNPSRRRSPRPRTRG